MSRSTDKIRPRAYDVLQTLKLDIFASINCIKVGEIRSFNPTKKTAVVQILFKRVLPSGEVRTMKPLADVPVFTLQGGGGGFQAPIAAGDHCLVLFSDRNLDAWFKTGTEQVPFDGRCHDLSDGIALVGLNAENSALDAYVPGLIRMFLGGAVVGCTGGQILLQNQTTDMVTLITALFTTLEAMQVVGNIALTPASIAALEVVKLQFLTLFAVAP